MSFDAVPLDHQNHPARVFNTGEKLDAVGAGVVGFLENVAKNLDILVAFFRLNMLDDDFLDHRIPLVTYNENAPGPHLSSTRGIIQRNLNNSITRRPA